MNSALEVAPHDPECQARIAEVLLKVETFFQRCVEAGQQHGEIPTMHTAEDLARMLFGIHLGIRVLARSRPERGLLEGMLHPALALLYPASVEEQQPVPPLR